MNAVASSCGRLWGGWLRSETKVCMHAFISLGAVPSETFASMDAFVSPSLQGYGLPDRARQGIFPARESYGKYPPASSTASGAKW